MTSISASYSGVVINQNGTPALRYDWRDSFNGDWVYQTFTLPTNYIRGSDPDEQIIPDLSGLQILLSIDNGYATAASLDYVLQYLVTDISGWNTLSSGSVMGSHADGNKVWYDIFFPQTVPVNRDILSSQFRFGLQTRTAANTAIG